MLRTLGAVAVAGVLVWSASASAARRSTPPQPRGNTKGLALLKRVRAAYRHVSAVKGSTRVGPVREHFTLLLRSGVTTAEQFVIAGPSSTIVLVARGTAPTYERETGSVCWRRLARANPLALEDIGIPFPDAYRMRVGAPRRVSGAWLLPAVTQGRDGRKTTITLRIDAHTMLVETESARAGGRKVVEHIKALSYRPRLAVPAPRC